MNVTHWPADVNSRFYGFTKKPKDNAKVTEMMGGRAVGVLLNTRHVFEISCSIRVEAGKELGRFWAWYTDVLGGVTGAFTCPALGDGYYRFTDVPDVQGTGRLTTELSFSIEEVY